MNKKYYLSMILILMSVEYIFPQSYKSSLIAETVFLSTETHNVEIELGLITKEYNEKKNLGGFSISYCGKINLGSEYYIEFRPGILLSQNAYDGLQFGLLIRKEINQFFGFLGLNSNYNFNPSHGTFTNENPEAYTYSFSIGGGIKISKLFGLLLSYNRLFDNYFGSGQTADLISKSTGYQKYLHYFVKVGVELNL